MRIGRDGRSQIWSSGHRNMLAAAVHPTTGELWVAERGPLNGEVTGEGRIDMQRRIRDVLHARDGALLVITDDAKGELLRVTPASPPR